MIKGTLDWERLAGIVGIMKHLLLRIGLAVHYTRHMKRTASITGSCQAQLAGGHTQLRRASIV